MSQMSARARPATASAITNLQRAAALAGVVFLVVGIAGFVPGLTTRYGDLQAAGPQSMAMLLGVFAVSALHNVVHLLFGVAGLAASRRWVASRLFFLGGGAVYLLLWAYGVVVDKASSANFVPVNSADNLLHLGLGALMLAAGLALGRKRVTSR